MEKEVENTKPAAPKSDVLAESKTNKGMKRDISKCCGWEISKQQSLDVVHRVS